MPSIRQYAKAVGIILGHKGGAGGWVYDNKGNVLCQGWDAYFDLMVVKGVIITAGNDTVINHKRAKELGYED